MTGGKDGRRARMEAVMRRYFDGCNEAGADKMLSCFAPGAAHYFPAGAPQGPFLSPQAIADGWKEAVAKWGSRWTIDRLIIDEVRLEAAMEWTHWKTKPGVWLRGAEWYQFDEDLLITEIRAYYAAPAGEEPTVHELGDFDYANRGFPLEPPRIPGRDS